MREETGKSVSFNHHQVGLLGLLVTLGIVFGDIGTSPLYVMKANSIQAKPSTRTLSLGHCPASSGHSPYRPPLNTYV